MSFIVFSASTAEKYHNIVTTLGSMNIPMHRVVTMWDGSRRRGAIIHEDFIDVARELSEVLLHVDENLNAKLLTSSGEELNRGTWVRKPHHEALGAQDFTFAPVTGNYYIVRWMK